MLRLGRTRLPLRHGRLPSVCPATTKMVLSFALTFCALVAPALGTIFNSYGEIQDATTYDFVIVGAGAGGAAMANRLTETNVSVLLVEAGGA